MFNTKALFARALLALTLALGAIPAFAGPLYKISIDTSSYATARYLDLQFGSLGGAEQAYAYVTGLSGNFTGFELGGDATGDLASGFTLSNMGLNSVLLDLVPGRLFEFNVSFDRADAGDGASFSVYLLDVAFENLLPGALQIELVPGAPDVPPVTGGGAEVIAVPEPSDWMLLATGLFLLGVTRRMQRR